jgi:type I restriction enzyme S subunit
MDQNIQKPSIRFKGFTDAWEQHKFDEVVIRIATGLNPRDNFQLNTGGKNYYVTIKNFHHGELRLDDDCDKVDESALALIQKRSDLQKDDILFSSIGRVGDCFLVDKTPKNWNIKESVFTLRPNQNLVSPLYLFHTIHSNVVL